MEDLNITLNLDEYKSSCYMDEFRHLYPDKFNLTPTGWKKLMDHVLSPLFEKHLGLKYLGGYIWASDFENHRRKVVRIFLINSSYGTLQWGWNFDFVPHLSGKKITYHRTDKAVTLNMWELSKDFGAGLKDKPNYHKTVLSDRGEDINIMAEEYRNIFNRILPEIEKYFTYTEPAQNLITEINSKLENGYYRFMARLPFTLSSAFLHSATGDKKRAKEILLSIEIKEDYKDVEEKLLKKLEQLPTYWTV